MVAASLCTWGAVHLGSLQVGTAGEGRVLVRPACPWAVLGRGLAVGVQLGRAAVRKVVAESGVAASLTLLGWGCELFLGYVACRGGRMGSSSSRQYTAR